jgi:hypothetical protein
MIDLIKELVQLLSQDPLSVEDVIARVGPIEKDPGGLMPIELRPRLSGVRSAQLARYPDNGLPYLLTIEPEAGEKLTTASLCQTFGDYKRLHTDRGEPPEIVFSPPASGPGWKVAIVATLQSASEPFDDQKVGSVSLRRDRMSV